MSIFEEILRKFFERVASHQTTNKKKGAKIFSRLDVLYCLYVLMRMYSYSLFSFPIIVVLHTHAIIHVYIINTILVFLFMVSRSS